MASTAGSTGGKTSLSLRSTATATVQIRNPAPTTAVAIESRRAAAAARRHSSPVVRSVRKVAPWNANSSTTAIPPSSVYRLKRSQKVPSKSPLELIGTP